MNQINSENSTVIIIDIQEKLVNAVFNRDIIIKKAEVLAKAANLLKIPTIITEQYPQGLGKTITEIKNNLNSDSSFYFEKTDFNALNESTIYNKIKKLNRSNIYIAGIESHICVYQTATALLQNGYNVSLLKDICSSRNQDEHYAGINLIQNNGAEIKTLEIFIFELLKSSKHPMFKNIQALIK